MAKEMKRLNISSKVCLLKHTSVPHNKDNKKKKKGKKETLEHENRLKLQNLCNKIHIFKGSSRYRKSIEKYSTFHNYSTTIISIITNNENQIFCLEELFSDEKKWNLDRPVGYRYFYRDLRKETKYFTKRNFGRASLMA